MIIPDYSQYRWPKQKVRLMQEVKPFRDRLFVYGIFLDKHNRDYYGMSNESYETVPDYATFGGGIVEAIHIPKQGLALTGLVVDIDPHYWERLDSLEAGYNRIKVITHSREEVYMYVGKE